MKRKATITGVAVGAIAAVSVACYPLFSQDEPDNSATTKTPSPTVETTTPPEIISQITIIGAGDVLLHMPVNADARTSDGYDYTPLFSAVHSYISGADLAICGMETSLAPPGEQPSGYPTFGAPDDIVSSLKADGWDGCSTANNHSADRGFAQLTHTLDVFDAQGLGHSGTARTEDEANQTQFYTVHTEARDITIAHLSYTTVDNMIPSFPGKPWAWNVTHNARATHTIDEVIERSRQAREKGADIVVVSYHWGNEYETVPSAEQTEIAQQLADSQVIDLVLGSHPHVAQPLTKLEGGPDGHGMWIIYSMGNLISNQNPDLSGLNVLTGALATATIEVSSTGSAQVTNLEWSAVTLDRNTHHIYFLSELESGKYTSTISAADLARRREAINSIMGTPERTDFTTSGEDQQVIAERR